MHRKPWRLMAVIVIVAIFGLAVGSPSASAAPPGSGKGIVRVTFGTPEGVPGVATLSNRLGQFAATKPANGTRLTVDVEVTSGQYDVQAQPIIVDGKRYVARSIPRSVSVPVGGVLATTVIYELSKGVQSVTTTALSATSAEFSVVSGAGNKVTVRRTEGSQPATKQGEGMSVAISGGVVKDTGLKPGTQYNYSFFAKPGDSAFGIDNASGPYVVSVGTSGGDAALPLFVVKPQTLIAQQQQILSVGSAGTGLEVAFAPGTPTLVPGAAVVLPISDILEGGYLGVIQSVGPDGRTVLLEAGGLLDAFDYYKLDIADISAFPEPTVAPSNSSATASSARSADDSNPVTMSRQEEHRAQRQARGAGALSMASKSTAAAPTSKAIGQCTTSGVDKIEFKPSLIPGGHFNVEVNKGLFGVPEGLNLDSSLTITAKGEVTAETSGAVECKLNLPEVKQQITTYPVPIAFTFGPEVKVSVSAAAKLSGVGAQITTGFNVKGSTSISGNGNFSATPIVKAEVLQPKAELGVHLNFTAGGTGLIGPGGATKIGGVIAGLDISLVVIDGDVGITVSNSSPPCFKFDLGGDIGLGLTAKAWLGSLNWSKSWQLLGGSFTYPGFPKTYPAGCDEPQGPGDSVIGDGVTKIDESVGNPDQSAYLDGFVPGGKAWVLSTGHISQAVGHPSFFASNGMGRPGDSALDVLAGRPTFDASSYTVTVVPTGSTLKVRYVFASEEYPEWVGSAFNDVMAVYVNGQNCAYVPGTSTPVSVNSINETSFSQYYVDNRTGASGYGTTMDGLTTPLTCSVPVTPGQPVQVRLVVADASDAVYDSAVALLDKGIWSE